MAHFQAVRSGLAISQSIADMLERADPTQYNGANRVQTIRETNDILQDRSELSLDMLYSLLAQTCGGEAGQVEKIRRDVEAFCVQKSNRARRYTLTGAQEYHYEMWDFDPKRPLKIISQPLFDHAAEHGFPPDFFTESYFDHVTIYCMPDNVDCSFSQFQSCQFSVCGIRGAVFDNATLDDTDFHSALLRMVNFTGASIAHSHFPGQFPCLRLLPGGPAEILPDAGLHAGPRGLPGGCAGWQQLRQGSRQRHPKSPQRHYHPGRRDTGGGGAPAGVCVP